MWKNFKYTHGYKNESVCALRLRLDDASILPTVPQDTVVLNGKGWYNLTLNSSDIRKLGLDLLRIPLESFTVKANKKYLYRVVGANNAFSLQISFESHKLRVVATDGNQIKPIENVDTLIVHGGERYDFEIETKNESFADNYVIFVKLLAIADEEFKDLNREYYTVGLLKYENAKPNSISHQFRKCEPQTPCITVNCPFQMSRNNRFKCINVESFEALDQDITEFDRKTLFKTHYDKDEFEEYDFNLHFSGLPESRSSINGKQFFHPHTPPFFPLEPEEAIKNCPKDCVGQKSCECTQMLNIKQGRVIQFTFYHMGRIDGLSCTYHPVFRLNT